MGVAEAALASDVGVASARDLGALATLGFKRPELVRPRDVLDVAASGRRLRASAASGHRCSAGIDYRFISTVSRES